MSDIQVRWIPPGGDAGDAFALRRQVFVEEQGFALELDVDGRDPQAHHAVCCDGRGLPVACARIFRDDERPDVFHFGRIAVAKDMRGTGMGMALMRELENKARSLGAKSAELGAQRQALGFYGKVGFTPFGEEYLEECCPHIRMKKELAVGD